MGTEIGPKKGFSNFMKINPWNFFDFLQKVSAVKDLKFTLCIAGNNSWSKDNDRQNISFDHLKYVMTGHSDRRLLGYL